MRARYTPLLLAAGLAAGFGQAGANDSVATLTELNGIAMVSQGSTYVNATQGMTLRQGDRLMAMEGGSAVVTYADGCVKTLDDNQILTLGDASSCTTGDVAQAAVGPYVAAAGTPPATAGLIAAGIAGTIVAVGAAGWPDTGSDDLGDFRQNLSP